MSIRTFPPQVWWPQVLIQVSRCNHGHSFVPVYLEPESNISFDFSVLILLLMRNCAFTICQITCDLLQMQIPALLNRLAREQVRGWGCSRAAVLVHLASGACKDFGSNECMSESLSRLESLTPSFSFYPPGLKKCVFSHQFILCGLSYKNAPAVFSI